MIFWGPNTLLPVVIIIRGLQTGLVSRYPLFYAYMATVLASTLMSVVISLGWGTDTYFYYYFFHFWSLVYAMLHFLLIWSVLQATEREDHRPAGPLLAALIVLMLVAATPAAWSLFRTSGFVLLGLSSVFLPAQMVGCIFVYCTAIKRRVNLGLNRKGLLAGLSLMVGFQSINYARYFVRDSRFEEFAFLVPLIYLLALGVFALTHWRYDPVRFA